MIDDKKIEEAAKQHAAGAFISEYWQACHKEGLVYCFVGVDEVKPVELTPNILEKNEWKKDKGDYINDSYHLHLCGKYDGYSVYKVVNDNVVWLTGVRNVSDLQHLLFGLGLNSEMEV